MRPGGLELHVEVKEDEFGGSFVCFRSFQISAA